MSSFFSVNKWRWVPFILYALVCSVFWIRGPVHYGGDSVRYIEAARQLVSVGRVVDVKAAYYLGYEIFVAAIYAAGLGDIGVIAVQIMLGGLAIFALFDLGRHIGGELGGIFAASLYAVNIELHQWTFYILTETLFTTTLIFVVWAVYRATEKGNHIGWLTLGLVLGAALPVIRPNGWVLLPVVVIYLMFQFVRKPGWKMGIYTILAAGIMVFSMAWLPYYQGIIPEHSLGLFFQGDDAYYSRLLRGEVIWNDAGTQIAMPSGIPVLTGGLGSVLRYCSQNTVACVNLFGRRIFLEAIYWRPYYSFEHNLGIALVLPVLYVFAILGVYRLRKAFFTWFILCLICVHFLFVSITWVDYNGRFLLYVLPLISLFGSLGMQNFFGCLCGALVGNFSGWGSE